jgi:hypothetical protein
LAHPRFLISVLIISINVNLKSHVFYEWGKKKKKASSQC